MDPFNDEAKKLVAKANGDPAQQAIALSLISIADSLAHITLVTGSDGENWYVRVGAEVSGRVTS